MSMHDLEKRTQALISSWLDYCDGLFTGLPDNTLQHRPIQDVAARVLITIKTFLPYYNCSTILTLANSERELTSKSCYFVFQSLHGSGLKYITDMLLPNEQSRTPRTSRSSLLVLVRVKTKNGKSSFCYHATKAWNNLPVHIRLATTLNHSWKSFTLLPKK